MKAKIVLTNNKEIILTLFEKDAPNTVKNFEKLANSGFYDGLTFHRVIPDLYPKGMPNRQWYWRSWLHHQM